MRKQIERRRPRQRTDSKATMVVLPEAGMPTMDPREPSPAELNTGMLLERLVELEFALENDGWLQLSGTTDQEFSRNALRKISHLAVVSWLKNPLVKQGVRVQANYVFGQGVNIYATDPEVNLVVQNFLDNSRNKVELTSFQAMSTKEKELTVYANLFFVFFTNTDTGQVRVRTIPFDEIDDVISNPEDSKEPWYYVRAWQRVEADGVQRAQEAYYPDWHYNPKDKPDKVNGREVMWDSPCYHVAVNKLSTMKFGVSEVYAAIDWAKAYKSFLEDWATLTRAYSRFAHKLSTPGGAAGVAAAKARLSSTYGLGSGETNPSPVVGSTFISSGGAELDPVRIGGANVQADDGRRLLLMVAASMGLPETFFGDVSVGTLATAKSLDRPTELQMVDRQTLWVSVLTAILEYVIVQNIKAPKGALKGKVIDEEDGTPRIELAGEADPTVEVVFPPILEHDVGESVDAIVKAATLGGSGTNAGIIPKWRELSRMLLTALGEQDVDGLLDTMFPEEQLTPEAVAEMEALLEEAKTARRDAGVGKIVGASEVALAQAFRFQGQTLLKEMRKVGLLEAEKDPEDDTFQLNQQDLNNAFDAAAEASAPQFQDALTETVSASLALGASRAQTGFNIGVSFDLDNPRAVSYLDEHGAELVAKIDDTTRDYIQTVVTQGVEEGWSYNRMASAITDRYLDFAIGRPQLHIDSRAHGIAVTEAGMAYEYGNRVVVDDLQESGLTMEKFWQTVEDDRVDPECAMNQAEGWIPVNQVFSSGDQQPLAHPYCRCTALYRRAEAADKPAAQPVPIEAPPIVPEMAPEPVAVEPVPEEPSPMRGRLPGTEEPEPEGVVYKDLDNRYTAQYWSKNQEGLNPRLSNDEMGAVSYYKGMGYMDINSALRDGDTPADVFLVPELDAAMSRSIVREPFMVHRAVELDVLNEGRGIQVGDILVDQGFTSTSALTSEVDFFLAAKEDSVRLDIRVPTGARALNLMPYEETNVEYEILLDRGAQFRILSDEGQGENRVLTLEVVVDE